MARRRRERKETPWLNISAQLATALPARESGGKLNQPLECERNGKQPRLPCIFTYVRRYTHAASRLY